MVLSRIIIPSALARSIRGFVEGLIPPNSRPNRNLEWGDTKNLQPRFTDLINQHPQFTKDLAEVLKNQSKIIFFEGLDFPQISKHEIPKTNRGVDSGMIGNRDAMICKISSALMMGLVVNINKEGGTFQPIFPTDESIGSDSKFDSNKDLLWHNDGWMKGTDELTILVGVKGHEAVKTKVILAEQIIDHFKKNGKEEELKYLMYATTIAGHEEDFDFEYGNIIDPKTRQIRYSQYGTFAHHNADSKQKQAVELLKKFLNEIDPIFCESLQSGDLLILQNKHSLHARKSSEPMKPGERLLLRERAKDGEGGLRNALPQALVSSPKIQDVTKVESLQK